MLVLLRVLCANLPLWRIFRARWRYLGGGDSHQRFLAELRQICEQNELEWPAHLPKRLGYYLTGVDWVMSWMVGLLGEKLIFKERKLGWYMAVLFALGDELSETNNLPQIEIKKAVLDKKREVQSPLERLIGYVYQQIHLHHPDIDAFEKYLELGLQAQDAALLQKEKTTSRSELRQIMFDKCGYAFLILRTAISQPQSSNEREYIYQLGGLIQLINDTFDVYEDCQDGIRTLPNTAQQISDVKKELETIHSELIQLIDASPKRKKRFFHQIAPIVATTRVCLWQFEQLEKRSEGRFRPVDYSRSELICDMEKMGNVWRAGYFLRKMKLVMILG